MKIETKLRLYEIKEKILKPFSEVRRVVSQFFETEYYYRWKKTIDPWWDDDGNYAPSVTRNLWYLNNTWDGCGPIFGLLDAKFTHIYHNLRVSSLLPDWYLDSNDVYTYGTEEEKTWAFNKLIKNELEHNLIKDENYKFIGKKYYAKKATLEICEIDDPKSDNGKSVYQVSRYIYKGKDTSYDLYRLEKVIREFSHTTEITDVEAFCSTGKDVKKKTNVYNNKVITLLNLGNDFNYKAVQYYFDDNSIDIKVVDDTIKSNSYISDSIRVEPKEFAFLSEGLKSHLHGRVVALHKVYQLRKDIDKLADMDIMFTEPYKSEYERIGFLDSKANKDRAWQALNEKFKEDQKALSAKVMEELLDCGEWTD